MLQSATAAKKCTKQRDARAKLLFFHINILIFVVLLTVTVVVGFVVIQKQCYHGNVTSHFSLLNKRAVDDWKRGKAEGLSSSLCPLQSFPAHFLFPLSSRLKEASEEEHAGEEKCEKSAINLSKLFFKICRECYQYSIEVQKITSLDFRCCIFLKLLFEILHFLDEYGA